MHDYLLLYIAFGVYVILFVVNLVVINVIYLMFYLFHDPSFELIFTFFIAMFLEINFFLKS